MSGPSAPRRVAFKTLGCKMNQSESESLASEFRNLGWIPVPFGDDADAVVVNTCTVTNPADRKSRSAVNQALRFAGKSAMLVVTGCFAQAWKHDLQNNQHIFLVDNGHKSQIPGMVNSHFQGKINTEPAQQDPFAFSLPKQIFRTRAAIKIQDGCDSYCSYCIIPFVRGRAVSLEADAVLNRIRGALAFGYKEMVLTGINLSRWQHGRQNFADLLESILNIKGDFRLRLGSVEPHKADTRFIRLTAHPKLAPHLHLCLQSGSDKILNAMRRGCSRSHFETTAAEIRKQRPEINLTTDVITGFPGETDDDFQQTLECCRNIGFGHIHTFPYSPRSGTKAAKMEDQVPNAVKKERAGQIRRLSAECARRFRAGLNGSVQTVLSEKTERFADGNVSAFGLSGPYVPVRFRLPDSIAPEDARNRFYEVRIVSTEPELRGECIAEPPVRDALPIAQIRTKKSVESVKSSVTGG